MLKIKESLEGIIVPATIEVSTETIDDGVYIKITAFSMWFDVHDRASIYLSADERAQLKAVL